MQTNRSAWIDSILIVVGGFPVRLRLPFLVCSCFALLVLPARAQSMEPGSGIGDTLGGPDTHETGQGPQFHELAIGLGWFLLFWREWRRYRLRDCYLGSLTRAGLHKAKPRVSG
jgi:hypothetical protein